jgi:probable addiction module antidote protein
MAKTKFSRFDAADYLKTEEDIAEFLNAAIEESDGDYSAIRRAIETAIRAKNVSELAKDADISRQGLYKAFSENGNPSFETVMKVSKALGVEVCFKAA